VVGSGRLGGGAPEEQRRTQKHAAHLASLATNSRLPPPNRGRYALSLSFWALLWHPLDADPRRSNTPQRRCERTPRSTDTGLRVRTARQRSGGIIHFSDIFCGSRSCIEMKAEGGPATAACLPTGTHLHPSTAPPLPGWRVQGRILIWHSLNHFNSPLLQSALRLFSWFLFGLVD